MPLGWAPGEHRGSGSLLLLPTGHGLLVSINHGAGKPLTHHSLQITRISAPGRAPPAQTAHHLCQRARPEQGALPVASGWFCLTPAVKRMILISPRLENSYKQHGGVECSDFTSYAVLKASRLTDFGDPEMFCVSLSAAGLHHLHALTPPPPPICCDNGTRNQCRGELGQTSGLTLSVLLPCTDPLLKPQIPISDCLFVSVLVCDTCVMLQQFLMGMGRSIIPA